MQSYAVNTPNIGDIPGVGGLSEQDGSNTENVNDADQTEDPPKLLPRPIPRPTGPPPNIDDGKNADQIQNPPKLVPRPTRPPLNTESKHTESGPSHREKWSTTEPNTDGIVEPVVLIPIPRPRPRPMFSPNTEDENTEDETSSQLKESNVDSNGNNEAKDDTVNTEGKPKSWLRTKPTHENLEDGSSNPRLPEANINDDLGVDEQEDYDSPIEKPFPHRPPSHGSENGEDESDYQRTVSNTDIGSEDSEGKGTSDRPKPRPRPWVPSGPLSDNDKHNEQDAEAESEIDESAKTVLEPQRQPGPVKENTEGESSGEESVAGINGNKQDKDNTVFRPKPRPGVAQRPDSDSGVADILNGMHKTGTKIFEHVKRADQSSFGTGEEQNEGSRVENERGADARWMFAKLSPDFGDKSTMLRKMPENMAKRRISNDGFARCFPPKLKRITRNAIDTIVQSFPDQRRKDLLRKMLPKENAEGQYLHHANTPV